MVEDAPELTQAELIRAVETWVERLERQDSFSVAEYLAFGRLWNTTLAHPSIGVGPERTRFLELVQREMPKMAGVLKMVPGRGFALTSSDYDFVLGGILDKRFQYRIKDP